MIKVTDVVAIISDVVRIMRNRIHNFCRGDQKALKNFNRALKDTEEQIKLKLPEKETMFMAEEDSDDTEKKKKK